MLTFFVGPFLFLTAPQKNLTTNDKFLRSLYPVQYCESLDKLGFRLRNMYSVYQADHEIVVLAI